MSFILTLDDDVTTFDILSDTRIPIPACNENFNSILPGDGTIERFAKIVGDNVGQLAIDTVIKQLHLEVCSV